MQLVKAVVTSEVKRTPAVTAVVEPVEKANTLKVLRKSGSSFTPSIKAALDGSNQEQTITEAIGKAVYAEQDQFEPFTKEMFESKWREFIEKIGDRPNLYATLSAIPELTAGNKLLLKVGNSVQEEEVRLIKPELMLFLKTELQNSTIEMETVIEKVETERTHFNDSEKLQIMAQKNPELLELRRKFNLDFNA